MSAPGSKTAHGRFFEDFRIGETLVHATPRTVTAGDQALYVALTGSRFALHCADTFAQGLGLPSAPVDDLLVFHMVFGKTVPDVSLNAVANLGYAACVFGAPVMAGDTLSVSSQVIGLKENSNHKTGVVTVRSTGRNQRGEGVLDYIRWVMVNKHDPASPAPAPVTPELPESVAVADLMIPAGLDLSKYDCALAGSPHLWDDYAAGARIDHVDGITIEEAEHQMATRLYQNTAKVHFNQQAAAAGRFGKRIVYGGHVISLARSLSFNGLGNGVRIAAINGGRHVAPCFAGDTVYAWSEVREAIALPRRKDVGALRLRTLAVKDRPAGGFPATGEDGTKADPALILDLDYTVLMPRR